MKTILFANGTEASYFFENNCWKCEKFDWDNFDERCPVAIKLEKAQELTNKELEEYFNGKPVEHYHKCLRFERREDERN